MEPEAAHHALGARLEPQAFAVAVVRDVVVAEAGVALPRPLLQPGDVVAYELAAVLIVADEALEAVDVLVQPDRVEVVAAEIPEGLHGRARIVGEAADPPLLCRREQVLGEVGALERLLERLVRGRRVLPAHVGAERPLTRMGRRSR